MNQKKYEQTVKGLNSLLNTKDSIYTNLFMGIIAGIGSTVSLIGVADTDNVLLAILAGILGTTSIVSIYNSFKLRKKGKQEVSTVGELLLEAFKVNSK